MSEQNTEAVEVADGAVDFVLGGKAEAPAHSPESKPIDGPVDNDAPFAADDVPEFLREEEKAQKAEPKDSAKDTQPGVDETQRLHQEIDTLTKRLHDTQKAMHEATTDRKKLQDELSALKAKEASDDDWFSEDDKSRVKEIESKLEENDKKMTELDEVAAQAVWDSAAAEVKAKHPDFEELVYDKFAPMLDDGPTGDATVKEMWARQKDKSPAAAYEFAKNLEARLEMQRDPGKYRERIRAEILAEMNNGQDASPAAPKVVTGKAGLDMVNSATSSDGSVAPRQSAVDFVFG